MKKLSKWIIGTKNVPPPKTMDTLHITSNTIVKKDNESISDLNLEADGMPTIEDGMVPRVLCGDIIIQATNQNEEDPLNSMGYV